jgi:1,4-alpha-glucan branching enzyme
MIRFITISLGSEGYLNFMGNEFGHPEWIDFPREGNNWSFQHCRRQWSLPDNPDLRYAYLNRFDQVMLRFMQEEALMGGGIPRILWLDQDRKIIAYRKKDFVFIFNFHPTQSYPGFQLPIHETAKFQVVLDTDEEQFGGQNRINHQITYNSGAVSQFPDFAGIEIYSPSRTAMVLKKN